MKVESTELQLNDATAQAKLVKAREQRKVTGWFTAIIVVCTLVYVIYCGWAEARWPAISLSSALFSFIAFAQAHGRVKALEQTVSG